jgi:hypothetical protein
VGVRQLNPQLKRNQERFSARFLVSGHSKGRPNFEITICDLKKIPGRQALPTLGLYRARSHHGGDSTQFQACHSDEAFVVRPFVGLREMLANNRQLAAKISELEDRRETHDPTTQDLSGAIKDLMVLPGTPRRKIGFQLPPAKRDSG